MDGHENEFSPENTSFFNNIGTCFCLLFIYKKMSNVHTYGEKEKKNWYIKKTNKL